jgi:hypothetical protein
LALAWSIITEGSIPRCTLTSLAVNDGKYNDVFLYIPCRKGTIS